MPRILGAEKNELRINDNLSGSTLVVYYRMPSTEERQGFRNMKVQRIGGKVRFRLEEAVKLYGPKILTGIRDGDFAVPDGDGSRLISSDPKSADYVKDWKEQIKTHAADVIELLAMQVFEGSVSTAAAETEEDETETAGEKHPSRGYSKESFAPTEDTPAIDDASGNSHET